MKAPDISPPSREFVEELRLRARISGWGRCDYTEIHTFVEEMYQLAGLPEPTASEMEPFGDEDAC